MRGVSFIYFLVYAHSKVPANLETLNRAGHLADLLVAVGSTIGNSSCPEHVVVACHVVWKLAASDGEPILSTQCCRSIVGQQRVKPR